MPVTTRPSLVMARGAGSWLWDETGRRYLDFVQGWAVNALGHCPVEVRRALGEQGSRLLSPSPAYHNRPQLDLAEKLCALTGAHHATFCLSGAEANEVAVKLARKWGRLRRSGAWQILTTWGAFHGRTLATMAASGKPTFDALFPPSTPGFRRVAFGDLAAARGAVDDSVAAVMVEPVQGEGGVVVPPPGYLAGLRELCDRENLLLICDEVQTGCGRLGTFLGQSTERVSADVTTLGKGLGAGVPVSAVLANERASCLEPGDQGGTHAGNPLLASVALAVVTALGDPDLLAAVRQRGAEMRETLSSLARRFGGAQPRGRGLLWALVFDRPVAVELSAHALDAGLLVNPAQPNVVRFMPQLRTSPIEVELMAERLATAWARLD